MVNGQSALISLSFTVAALLFPFIIDRPIRNPRWRIDNYLIIAISFFLNLAHGVHASIRVWKLNGVAWCDIATVIANITTITYPCLAIVSGIRLATYTYTRSPKSCPWYISTGERYLRNWGLRASIILLPSIAYIFLNWIVSISRFDIIENYGCFSSYHDSYAGILAMLLPLLIFSLPALAFCGVAIRESLEHLSFSGHLAERRIPFTKQAFYAQLVQTVMVCLVTLTIAFSGTAMASVVAPKSFADIKKDTEKIVFLTETQDTMKHIVRWWCAPVIGVTIFLCQFTSLEVLSDMPMIFTVLTCMEDWKNSKEAKRARAAKMKINLERGEEYIELAAKLRETEPKRVSWFRNSDDLTEMRITSLLDASSSSRSHKSSVSTASSTKINDSVLDLSKIRSGWDEMLQKNRSTASLRGLIAQLPSKILGHRASRSSLREKNDIESSPSPTKVTAEIPLPPMVTAPTPAYIPSMPSPGRSPVASPVSSVPPRSPATESTGVAPVPAVETLPAAPAPVPRINHDVSRHASVASSTSTRLDDARYILSETFKHLETGSTVDSSRPRSSGFDSICPSTPGAPFSRNNSTASTAIHRRPGYLPDPATFPLPPPPPSQSPNYSLTRKQSIPDNVSDICDIYARRPSEGLLESGVALHRISEGSGFCEEVSIQSYPIYVVPSQRQSGAGPSNAVPPS